MTPHSLKVLGSQGVSCGTCGPQTVQPCDPKINPVTPRYGVGDSNLLEGIMLVSVVFVRGPADSVDGRANWQFHSHPNGSSYGSTVLKEVRSSKGNQ